MDDRIEVLKKFYDESYAKDGFNAQRRYPNEEFSRYADRALIYGWLPKKGLIRMGLIFLKKP